MNSGIITRVMKSADRVLELLYDRRGGFVAADELCARGAIAPGRLAKTIESLQQRGQAIEFSPAQGYRLAMPCRLDAHLVEHGLGTRRVGRNVICFDEVGSTNDVAFDSARQAGADGLVVLAESQRAGRGRLGRKWVSPPGKNVLMSVVLLDPQTAGETPAGREGRIPSPLLPHEAVTIAAGLAAAEGIEAACGLAGELKWPNDVLIDGAKVCGVLVEVHRLAKGGVCTVVGMGINANALPPAEDVDRPAVSLAERLGQAVDRIEVARAVLRRLDVWVANIAQGRIDELHDAWMARCGMVNHRVSVSYRGATHTGRVLDVSPLEGLILCRDDGTYVHLKARGATVVG